MYVIVTADLELLEDVLNWVCIFFSVLIERLTTSILELILLVLCNPNLLLVSMGLHLELVCNWNGGV